MADFTTRFNELLSRSAASDSGLAESLGVSKQTISAWKNGVRFPKRPAIRTIAAYFGVGVPWLEGVTDDETAAANTPFGVLANACDSDARINHRTRDAGDTLDNNIAACPEEAELLTIYRDLNDLGQQALLGTARGLAANPDMKKGGASNDVTA